MKKLSKAQIDLLLLICDRPRYIAEYYAPARVIVAQKLAAWTGSRAHVLAPTEAGLEMAKQHNRRLGLLE